MVHTAAVQLTNWLDGTRRFCRGGCSPVITYRLRKIPPGLTCIVGSQPTFVQSLLYISKKLLFDIVSHIMCSLV